MGCEVRMNYKSYNAVNQVHSKAFVDAATKVSDVVAYFRKNSSQFLAVATNGKINGLISREKLLVNVGSQFGWSLHADSPIATLMDKKPLIYDGKGHTIDLLRRVVKRPIETVYDDVIIAMGGVFSGLVSVKQLMLFELDNLDDQLKVLEQQRALLQKTIATHLLDQNVSPEVWERKILAIVNTAQKMETLEQDQPELADDSSVGTVKLHGNLEAFSVIDLIQLLVQGGKTGRLELKADAQSKDILFTIFVLKGRIVHVEGKDCDGGHFALWQALKVTEGDFTFHYGCKSETVTIQENPMTLLLEACRRQDEEDFAVKEDQIDPTNSMY